MLGRHVQWIMVVCSMLGACGSTRVTTRATLAARSKEMNTPQRIALIPASGSHGRELTMRLKSAIVGGRLHTLLATPDGATVTVTGQVLDDDYSDKVEDEVQKRCVAQDKKGRCTKNVDVTVYNRSEYCASTVVVSATSRADGRVLVAKTIREGAANSNTNDGHPPEAAGASLCSEAFNRAAELAVRYISPYQAEVALEFHDIDDGGDTEKAVGFAKVSDFEAAKAVLSGVIENQTLDPPAQAWARYNLAVVLWALADFRGCIEQLDSTQGTLGAESAITTMYRECKEYQQ